MTCRQGCATPGAHRSWGECLRAANVHVPQQESQFHGRGYSPRVWDAEIRAFKDASAQGIIPASTRMNDIRSAVAASRAADAAFDATTGRFA